MVPVAATGDYLIEKHKILFKHFRLYIVRVGSAHYRSEKIDNTAPKEVRLKPGFIGRLSVMNCGCGLLLF